MSGHDTAAEMRATLAGSAGPESRVDAFPPDEALLERIAGGDVDALTELYDRHRSMAYAIALRITGSVAAAEDVLQDAFLGAWRNASRFERTRGTGRSWLLSIVHHRAIDHVRRARTGVELPDADAAVPPSLVAPDVWPEIAGRLDAEVVRLALGRLPEVQRSTIELAYWGGLTQSEIAERSGVPLGTVKSRIRLGLLALRRELIGSDGPGGIGVGEGTTHLAPPAGGPPQPPRMITGSSAAHTVVRWVARWVRGAALRRAVGEGTR